MRRRGEGRRGRVGPGPADRSEHGLETRVAGIVAAIAAMVAGVLFAGPLLFPPEVPFLGAPDQTLVPAASPIAAEADVFRMQPGDFGADPDPALRVQAHRRTIAMHRRLRAFPGAPPRIPHGLTEEEFKGGHCNTCHERGGFVERFAAYAPVTPHPELGQCLQCHVADDRLVGLPVSLPPGTPVCGQCHILASLAAPPPQFVALDWPTPHWPELGQAHLPGAPPAIPHPLHFRGNCVACHAGLGAVHEIRTTHPWQSNCRQCHVESGDDIPPFDPRVFTPSMTPGGSP